MTHHYLTFSGVVFLTKALFTTYTYTPRPTPEPSESQPDPVDEPEIFQISFPALLETLQIFGAADTSSRFRPNDENHSTIRAGRQNVFSNHNLGMPGICRFSYTPGSPFSIILEENGVVTTCDLVTYEAEDPEEIPFSRQETEVKIIMQARYLHDAISELSLMSPERLDIAAYIKEPWFSLSGSGALGSASVEFAKSRNLLETFSVGGRWGQSYKFDMVYASLDAMRLASKVSIRGDHQGVLSLQFMVEVESGGVSFVDFRFVPFSRDEDETEDDEGEEVGEELEDDFEDDD